MKCSQCGGRLRRVHRTLLERLRYSSIYYCKHCDSEEYVPRIFQYRLGEFARCPECGTHRLTKLKELDKIDRVHWGWFHLIERLSGGTLYHCRYCRIQFHDRRSRSPEAKAAPAASRPREAEPPDEEDD